MIVTTIIEIGNSRGIRIPKPLLSESGLEDKVELQAKRGEIKIIAAPVRKAATATLALSEKALGADWNRPEEDKAWKSLQ